MLRVVFMGTFSASLAAAVERHLSSAYQKLGIRSRFQLADAIAD